MNTFDAISHIRRESLSRADALRYLMANLGLCTAYAEEIVTVVCESEAPAAPPQAPVPEPAPAG